MLEESLPPPPNGLPLETQQARNPALVAAADRAARYWSYPVAGNFAIGSAAHKRAACLMFQDTFNPYKPTIIDWPKLDAEARERLISLPIWDIAVQTEGKARQRMNAYAASLEDAEWRRAIGQNGWEEGRHKLVLSNLVQAYGIQLAAEPDYAIPRDPEWAYLVTGYSECIDSFFAFGLFETARRSGFFPPELVDTFEPVMQEECRHILLFANWVAWQRRKLSLPRRIWFELRVAAVWVFLGLERLSIAKGMDAPKDRGQDNNFTITGTKAVSNVDISVPELMGLCLAENDRRFSGYDSRLLRPVTMPILVRFALRLMKRWRRKAPARAAA